LRRRLTVNRPESSQDRGSGVYWSHKQSATRDDRAPIIGRDDVNRRRPHRNNTGKQSRSGIAGLAGRAGPSRLLLERAPGDSEVGGGGRGAATHVVRKRGITGAKTTLTSCGNR